MIFTFADYDDQYKLVLEADPSDPKTLEACREINNFWSDSEHRLLHAQTEIDEYLADDPRELVCAAGMMIVHHAVIAGLSDGARDTERLLKWFARGVEGYPTDLSEYGIKIVSWELELPSTESMYIRCEEAKNG